MKPTRVSVLMPLYNASQYLREAIESILQQTFQHFEFVIINDGSTDNSEQIILQYSDPRIRYFHNEENKGLVYTLNKGLELCQGAYIARMDADDISHPDRLKKQVDFMIQNPKVGVLGSWMKTIPRGKIHKKPCSNEEIKASMFFNNPFAHPTVMLRKSVIENHRYDHNFLHIEDYEFWIRLASKMEMANLPEVLLEYRIHDLQISMENSRFQVEQNIRLKYQLFSRIVNLEEKPFLKIWENMWLGRALDFEQMYYPFVLYKKIKKTDLLKIKINPTLFKKKFIQWLTPALFRSIPNLSFRERIRLVVYRLFWDMTFKMKVKFTLMTMGLRK